MCGIIGIVLARCGLLGKPIGSVLRDCLKKLEYRGYDSVGFAIIDCGNKLVVRKSRGMIDAVHEKLGFDFYDGYIGIGHTRWATHGAPTDVNAHPHTDCVNRIAVVHNGIIENYRELRESLIDRGHRFVSSTDTEVIPHLIEEFKKAGYRPYEAFKKSIELLRGTYAIIAIDLDEPGKIFYARNTSPLVIGFGNNANFIASDIPAFLEYTRRVLVLEDGEIGYITHKDIRIEKILDVDGDRRWIDVDYSRRIRVIGWSPEMASKGGYRHYMLKEIHEQPYAISMTISSISNNIDDVTRIISKADRVIITGAGTSYHAGYIASMLFTRYADIFAIPIISSEAMWWLNSIRSGDIVIGISQSGETIDTLKAVREARKRGALTIAISNVIDSTIPRESDIALYTNAGPEIGVAATKTFTSQVTLLSYLVINVARYRGIMRESEAIEYMNSLKTLPSMMKNVLNIYEAKVSSIANEIKDKQNAFFLGRGLGLPLSMEGALKLKEIAYIHAEAYPAGESKHGPIALVEDSFPTIFTITSPSEGELIRSNIEEMNARGSITIAIFPKNLEDIEKLVKFSIKMPIANDFMVGALYIVPHQLLAYYTSVKKGLDPDKPRNLAKTVTVF